MDLEKIEIGQRLADTGLTNVHLPDVENARNLTLRIHSGQFDAENIRGGGPPGHADEIDLEIAL